MTVNQGYATQLGISASNPVDARFEFLRATLAGARTIVTSEGVSGNRSVLSGRGRVVSERCSGQLVMQPTVVEIDALLPWLLGGSTSGGVTDVADALAARYITLDKVQKVYTYAGCYAAQWRLEGAEGQPLNWTIDVEGKTETVANAGTFPSLSLDTGNFFVYKDCTLTLAGTGYAVRNFAITLNNVLDADRFLNSLTRGDITPQSRLVTLEVTLPFGDAQGLIDSATIGSTGIAGSLAFSDGTTTYTIAFANLKAGTQGAQIEGRTELYVPISFQAFRTSSASEFKVTKS